jgi:putative ABC transport system substrate-binding protein
MRFNQLARREFIALLGGAAAMWPLGARAQQPERMRRVAILASGGADDVLNITAFRRALDGLGWHEGRNIQIELRRAEGDIDHARGHAVELMATTPDVFFVTNTQMAQIVQAKTRAIPIVFVSVPDPIGSGLAVSFAHPGGNVTGFTNFDPSMGGKWLGLLKDVRPDLKRVAVILQAGNPTAAGYLKMVEATAQAFALQVSAASLSDGPSIDAAVEAFAREPGGGLVVPPSALATVYQQRIIMLAAQNRLPAIYPYSEFTAAGGLMSYGLDRTIVYQQAASYVDRILNGEKASDLPIQTPTKFELVVNLKTAKALGLTIPESFLLLANEVIE